MISGFIIILEYTFNKIPRYSIIVYFHPNTASSSEYHVFTVHKQEEDLCIVLEVGKFEKDRMPAEGKMVELYRVLAEVQGKMVELDRMPVEGKMVVLDRVPVEGRIVEGKIVEGSAMEVVQGKFVVVGRLLGEGRTHSLDKIECEERQ